MKRTSDNQAVFYPGDPVCDALFVGPKALRNRDKQFKEGPIEFLPGHMSNDWPVLLFKKEVSEKLTSRFPESVDEYGRVTGNGVRSNFYGVRHVNGYPMRPATFPIADNRGLRTQAGLANDFVEPWHRAALVALVELFFTSLQPVAMRLRKGASSMMPVYETRMTARQDIARFSLASGPAAARLISKGDYENAWRKYHIGGAYHTVYRRQSSDAVAYEKGKWFAKDRAVADLQYAISGGRSGTYLPASKELGDVDFRHPEGFFRERNRTAQGGPFGLNANLMPIAQAARAHMYEEYAYTLHHTTRESMQASLRDWKFSIAADVSSHDMFWPTFLIPVIKEGMARAGVRDWWLELYDLKSRLPLYVTDVDEGLGNLLIGDWRKPDLHPGLPSGNALTDIEGTIGMVWIYFMLQVEHTLPALKAQCVTVEGAKAVLDRYLKGLLPIRLKDKSDDALLGWTDSALVPAATALLEKMKKGDAVSPYMKISYEHGGAFLGNILLYPESKEFSGMVMIGNIISLLINQFSPEYSVQSGVRDRSRVKRPFPGLAWETYAQVYGSSPIYGQVMDLIEECWFNQFHESYRGYRDKLLAADRLALEKFVKEQAARFDTIDLTLIDHEVLADPSKLQYKYEPGDVNPGVLDLLFQGLPLAEVEPFFRNAYR